MKEFFSTPRPSLFHHRMCGSGIFSQAEHTDVNLMTFHSKPFTLNGVVREVMDYEYEVESV